MSRPTPWTTDLALWLALLAGFSPVLLEYARGFAADYSPPSTLLAPLLIALCLWRGVAPEEAPRRAAGLAAIAAGLGLELAGIALQVWTVAWLGFPVAVVGVALWLGRPSWRVAALAFGLVPVPVSLQVGFTPAPESALLAGACAAWGALGVDFDCSGPTARQGGRLFDLTASDAGWTLVPVLAQLGWFSAVSAGAGAVRALGRALGFAAASLVVQPLAVFIALGVFALDSRAAAQAWLAHGVWLVCAAGVLLWWRTGRE